MEITKRVQEKGYECIILNPNCIFWHDGKAQVVTNFYYMGEFINNNQ
jgi:hypothetical protein